ncbi:MAG: hypothetical protein A2145_03210 [candidate division Zixibacteria bacterium RBG_16_40_9]|nr:MAG: hypothetical protein A2145_03210 [candidate division Zixibacteria bacterium RBG_16_40_9]
MTNFSAIRKQFPFTKNIIYFNHAAFGPVPLESFKATLDYYHTLTHQVDQSTDHHSFELLDRLREIIAKMINSSSDEISLTSNTSYGLNIVANGIEFKAGDEILLSDIEFPANVYPWLNLKKRGVKVRFIKNENGFFSLENLLKAINKKTKLLSLSFVQFFNGYKNDLERIGKICQDNRIIFVVDGIQGIGNSNLDVKKCKIDFLSCGGQKWLLSAPGTGFFYCSKKFLSKLQPSFFGWLGVDWKVNFTDLLRYNLKPFNSARRFEIGSYSYANLRTFYASLKLLQKIGIANIQKQNHILLDRLIDYLQNSAYQIKSSQEAKHRSSILSFSAKNGKKLWEELFKNKIIVSYREDLIRVSPNFYNSPEEIDHLIATLQKHPIT